MSTVIKSIKRKALWTAIATTLAIGPLAAVADSEFRMQAHPLDVDGKWELEHGQYDRAITLLEIGMARSSRTSHNRGALLTDLCFAYTAVGKYADANRMCDEAVQRSTEIGIAYNNRGVLHAVQGDVAAASVDFEVASQRHESADTATFNITRIAGQVSDVRLDTSGLTAAAGSF